MRDEKKYLTELITELKRFFTLPAKEREKAALDLDKNYYFDSRDYSKFKDWQKKACKIELEDNSKISAQTEDIVARLSVLHHYRDNPDEYDYEIKNILKNAEAQLKILCKKK